MSTASASKKQPRIARGVKASKRPHVALIIETAKGYGRGLLRGIARYVRTHKQWSIYVDERSAHEDPPSWLRNWDGDGVIVRASTRTLASEVAKLKVPVVHALRQFEEDNLPAVYSDPDAISRMVAARLIERQFRNFAFVGVEGAYWSTQRSEALVEALASAGLDCQVYAPLSRKRFSKSWEGGQDDLCEWIHALPKPVGIMAAHDLRALCVLDACRRVNAAVPEQVAVVGVDNDEVLCELADPPLTSVAHQLDIIGYEAAGLLDRMMDGGTAPEAPLLLEPQGLISRRSTDIVAIEDPVIASAIRFVREHACDGINVQQICDHVGVSRRLLERGFNHYFHRSPHEQVLQVQIEHVKRRLAETEETLDVIAADAGFSRAAYLSVVFKQQTGQTPGEFRRYMRHSHGERKHFSQSVIQLPHQDRELSRRRAVSRVLE
jgi:LacI family transcriptional regulator, galactose operon repressor